MTEAARTSETLVNFYQTTRRNNPEDSHLRKFTSSWQSCFWTIIAFQLNFKLDLQNYLYFPPSQGLSFKPCPKVRKLNLSFSQHLGIFTFILFFSSESTYVCHVLSFAFWDITLLIMSVSNLLIMTVSTLLIMSVSSLSYMRLCFCVWSVTLSYPSYLICAASFSNW
jgi:hypothetical protein